MSKTTKGRGEKPILDYPGAMSLFAVFGDESASVGAQQGTGRWKEDEMWLKWANKGGESRRIIAPIFGMGRWTPRKIEGLIRGWLRSRFATPRGFLNTPRDGDSSPFQFLLQSLWAVQSCRALHSPGLDPTNTWSNFGSSIPQGFREWGAEPKFPWRP